MHSCVGTLHLAATCPFKTAPSRAADMDPHLIRGSLSWTNTTYKSQPTLKGHVDRFSPTHTHTQTTLRGTRVAIGRINALCAGDTP